VTLLIQFIIALQVRQTIGAQFKITVGIPLIWSYFKLHICYFSRLKAFSAIALILSLFLVISFTAVCNESFFETFPLLLWCCFFFFFLLLLIFSAFNFLIFALNYPSTLSTITKFSTLFSTSLILFPNSSPSFFIFL